MDENGEPLLVYHGTVHGGFRVFDVDVQGKTEGSGAFFASDKRVAEGYRANFHTGGVTPEVDVFKTVYMLKKSEEVSRDLCEGEWNPYLFDLCGETLQAEEAKLHGSVYSYLKGGLCGMVYAKVLPRQND